MKQIVEYTTETRLSPDGKITLVRVPVVKHVSDEEDLKRDNDRLKENIQFLTALLNKRQNEKEYIFIEEAK